MNGRLSKKGRMLDSARFAICDFHEHAGKVMLALMELRKAGLVEPHHVALAAPLVAMAQALETWHEAEARSVAEFNRRAPAPAAHEVQS